MNAYLDEVGSPLGLVAFAVNEEGALLALRFRDGRSPKAPEKKLKREGKAFARDEDRTSAAREQLAEHFAGEQRSFGMAVARRGSALEEAVWEELSRIPCGETRTYGRVAEACAANPVLLVVPCHRVVGYAGSLKGYAGGLPVKARLLDFEGSRKPLFA